ncbi:MAG: Fic family protein [Candidatus Bathyarchaeia archaeon]|jgi:Fic family protein
MIDPRLYKRILQKKKQLDSLRPLPPALVKKLKEQLYVNYTYNSNAIEGNTLTLNETRLIIQEGITVGGKTVAEVLEAKNHPESIMFIEKLVESETELDEQAILTLHGLLMSKIVLDAGLYRTTGVVITGATFRPPPSSEIRARISELLTWLKKNPDEYSPIELAAVFHHRFVQIHPFVDGNGRTARLLMNAILMKNGYPFISVIPQQDRKKYINSLVEADLKNLPPLVNFIARCAEHSLDMYLDAVEEPQVLALSEASKITSYSQEYLSLLARKGALGAYKQGRNWVVTKTELERYLRSVKKLDENTQE